MKRKASVLGALILTVALLTNTVSAMASAETLIEADEIELPIIDGRISNSLLQGEIESYFETRETAVNATENLSTASATSNNMIRLSNMEELGGISVLTLENSTKITSAVESGDYVYVTVYEWNTVTYTTPGSDIVDTMGYLCDHEILLQSTGTGYAIIADVYDEGLMTGLAVTWDDVYASMDADIMQTVTDLRNVALDSNVGQTEEYSIIQQSNAENLATMQIDSTAPYALPSGTYDVAAAVIYSEQYVIHAVTDGMNFDYYNDAFDIGGASDCANFVSQCLYAGGCVMDTSWRHTGSSWTTAWVNVRGFDTYWKDTIGVTRAVVSTNGSNVFAGNPVYWLNPVGASSSGHLSICVGRNGNGTPILNAHNRDVYHVPYTFFQSEGRTLYTLNFATSEEYGYNPGYSSNMGTIGTSLVSYSTAAEVGAVEWIKFTASSAGTYVIESTTHNSTPSSPDVDAVLYQGSATSNETTIYMIKVAQNANGGVGNHFKITATLTPGEYFILVTGVAYGEGANLNVDQFYKVTVQKTS